MGWAWTIGGVDALGMSQRLRERRDVIQCGKDRQRGQSRTRPIVELMDLARLSMRDEIAVAQGWVPPSGGRAAQMIYN